MWATWWLWLAVGAGLAILEVVVPGYIFLGFAIGAGVTGGLLWVGGPFAAWLAGSLPMLMLFFAVMSLVAWIILRMVFRFKGGGSVKTFDHDINEN